MSQKATQSHCNIPVKIAKIRSVRPSLDASNQKRASSFLQNSYF